MIVCALSHLAVSLSEWCPPEAASGRALSTEQTSFVGRVERFVHLLLREAFAPASRTGKVSSLIEYHDNARAAAPDGLPPPPQPLCSFDIIASRCPSMSSPSAFDSTPFLGTFESACLLEPNLCAKDAPDDFVPPPRIRGNP